MIERIDEVRCDGCGICIEICPSDVLRLVPGERLAAIVHREDCQTCFSCEIDCPEDAIFVDPTHAPKLQIW